MKDPHSPMLPVPEALALVLRETRTLAEEAVPLEEAAERIAAGAVRAEADQPPFDRAMVDGYALRAADSKPAPVELEVVEEIPAGRLSRRRLEAGEAARIMTGAPVPEGADAVQKVESTAAGAEANRVRILEAVEPRANVAPAGNDLKAGEEILSPGERITSARLGLLAGAGAIQVRVHRRPEVRVAATGDELVEAGRSPGPGQIRNSNSPALSAAARRLGARVGEMGIVRDHPEALAEALERGLRSDLLLLSGGVSMGDYDLVEPALIEQGVELFFRKVAIRPGKPAVFGRKGPCLVFGLPGNPVSSLVVFEVLVAPAIRKMLGIPRPEGEVWEAVAAAPVRHRPGRASYLPGLLQREGGTLRVVPVPTSGSADLRAHSRADALIIVPSDRERIDAGERAAVLPLHP